MQVHKKNKFHLNKLRVWFLASALIFFTLVLYLVLATSPQPAVKITPTGNFFSQPIKLQLTTTKEGTIRYTTDGSNPTETSPTINDSIEVSESMILKVAVFSNGQQQSEVQSHDIFIDANHTVPILSLTTDPRNLWDPEIGIYVEGNHTNFGQDGEEWERPATLRFYENSLSTKAFEQTIAIRLHGRSMRGMPQKAFRIYFKDSEGKDSTITYPLFKEDSKPRYSSVILRNGGGDNQYAMIRDRLAAELAQQGTNLDVMAARPVVLYLNGEYWGLYYLRERFDETYLSQKYQVKEDGIAIVEIPLSSGEDKGLVIPDNNNSQTDATLFNRLLSDTKRCTHCVSYGAANSVIDVSNLIDYYIFEFFSDNTDWPYNNAKAWRYRSQVATSPEAEITPQLDGRFRWLLFDIDGGFAEAPENIEQARGSAQTNSFSFLVDNAFPFRNLFYNPQFRSEFQQRMDHLTATTLSSENTIKTVDQLAAEIRPEMPRHIERWGDKVSDEGRHTVSSIEEWEENLRLLKAFLEVRPKALKEDTAEFLESSKELAEED